MEEMNRPLFQQEDKNGITYRIPALLYIPHKHTFLAFAEKRSTLKDEDALHLVMRRGLRTGHSVEWGPQEPLMEAILPGHRTMNPCPVWERKNSCVYLFFICIRDHVTECHQIVSGRNAARLCFICSQDAGHTWSKLRDLTEEVIEFSEMRHWATFAVGPGHGIQIQSGRLIIPAYAYYFSHRFCGFPLSCFTKAHSLMIYSDDFGLTWHHGKFIRGLVTVECQVAEVTGKSGFPVLYCSARTPNRFRAEALSINHGECFQRQALNLKLCEPPNGCQGSILSIQPLQIPHRCQDPDDKDAPTTEKSSQMDKLLQLEERAGKLSGTWLLYSHPTNKKKRINLGIYLNQSPLDTAGWSQPWILHDGPSGYSDLALVEEQGLFGCLFECGSEHECEQIVFRLFTHLDVLSHTQEDCARPAGMQPEPVQH
ncbi:PREDICTED: sialidase-3 [Dipodomys ordii]|uniref:exo-alpha-sialidase n=1 Tax=Dipodomys ordii TaxID=10020 RepID=A0A1S3EZX7_DIPOR|nr:PREDICTED: sialidase-3 [Dipodomys ordii]XP_012869490.1 PREDICTED: sialidase-3 [Dipodomys ordii]